MIGAIVQIAGTIVQTTMNVVATEISINEQWKEVNAQIRGETYFADRTASIVLSGVGTGLSQASSAIGNGITQEVRLQEQQQAYVNRVLQQPTPNYQLQPTGPLSKSALSTPSTPPSTTPNPPILDVDLPEPALLKGPSDGFTMPPGSLLNYREPEPVAPPVPQAAPKPAPAPEPAPVPASPGPSFAPSDLISSEELMTPAEYASINPSSLNISQ